MNLHNLVNSSDWDMVEQKMKEVINKETTLDETKEFKDIAIEALANQKMKRVLSKFLEDMGFYKQKEKQNKPRTFK